MRPRLRPVAILKVSGVASIVMKAGTASLKSLHSMCAIDCVISAPTKISAVAALLGYNVVQDFNRFFKKHMHESPSVWSRKERARIASEEAGSSNE